MKDLTVLDIASSRTKKKNISLFFCTDNKNVMVVKSEVSEIKMYDKREQIYDHRLMIIVY